MPEKINFVKHLEKGLGDDFVAWFIIHAITESSDEGKKIIEGYGKDEKGTLELCLTVNGIEVPIMACIAELEKQLDHLTNEKAAEKVVEILNRHDILHDIAEINYSIRDKIRDIVEKELGEEGVKEFDNRATY